MEERKDRIVQSITAYRCRICKKYRNEDLLIKSDENKEPLSLEALLYAFFNHIKKCQIDKYTSRALLLSQPVEKIELEDSTIRLLIQPNAGKALENFAVVNYKTNEVKGYKGEEHSAVYAHNVIF